MYPYSISTNPNNHKHDFAAYTYNVSRDTLFIILLFYRRSFKHIIYIGYII